MDSNNQPITESDSLETPIDSPDQTGVVSAPSQSASTGSVTPQTPGDKPKGNLVRRVREKVNIYFVLLIVILALLAGISYFAIINNRQSINDTALKTQSLNQDALDKLAGTDAKIGDPKQTLSVESNAIFAGGLLVRGNIDVVGSIKLGGNLSLAGLTVGGTTSLEQLASKSLTVAGDAAIQGKMSVQNGLSVNGTTSFNGGITASQLTVDNLQLNSDLKLSRHVVASGGVPGRTNGTALGGGGTATVSGTDTAGTVSINTGNSAPAGCFVTINFIAAYASAPRVIVSPASSAAASISYYTNRTTTGFSICTASDPADNTSGITFDYFVIG